MVRSVREPVLYAADVTPLEDAGLYAAAYAAVTPDRKAKADRFRLAKDRRLCLGAELLLRYGLREAGIMQFPETLCIGAQGKPAAPETGLEFNLSHSGTWVLCALGGFPLGCDLEEIRPVDLKLGRRFHPLEYTDILSMPTEQERLMLFYRYWTLKESFLKATGLGMTLPLDGFLIRRDGEITVAQSVNELDYSFREFMEIPGFCCALCGAGDCSGAELHILNVGALLEREVRG